MLEDCHLFTCFTFFYFYELFLLLDKLANLSSFFTLQDLKIEEIKLKFKLTSTHIIKSFEEIFDVLPVNNQFF